MPLLQRLAHHVLDLFQIQRLEQVVKGPGLETGNGAFDGPVGGDHDHPDLGIDLPDLSQQLATVSREVREGQALSTTLSGRGLFPSVAVKMVEVGESTGALQEMLTSVADFFGEEIETSLSRFMTVIEPILLVIMGIVIAGLLLALYMPLIQLGSIVS